MREFAIVAIGLGIGVVVGRFAERSRRAHRDFITARGAFERGRKVMVAEGRKAALVITMVGVFMIAIFVGALNWPR